MLSDTPGILEPQYPCRPAHDEGRGRGPKDADMVAGDGGARQLPDRAEGVLQRARRFRGPMLVLVNKIDLGGDQEGVACMLGAWHEALPEAEVLPVSALHGFHVPELREKLVDLLPEHPPYFPKDELSDRNTRFFISEFIRRTGAGASTSRRCPTAPRWW